jgi:D-3-phosphoglycerate dehydrogenase
VRGKNSRYPPSSARGSELCGKKCLVLGCGKIGSKIAKLLAAFGCRVLAFSRTVLPDLEKEGVRFVPLADGLKEADIIFVALPLSPETRHLLGDSRLSLVRDGASIVNISRGEIIDSCALLKHIDRLGFVATDVLENQNDMENPAAMKLLSKNNFLRTPYIGAFTKEALSRLPLEVEKNIIELEKLE